MKVYTRKGDDGTTGLFYGGRVPQGPTRPRAYGTVDEAQAAARRGPGRGRPGDELDACSRGCATTSTC